MGTWSSPLSFMSTVLSRVTPKDELSPNPPQEGHTNVSAHRNIPATPPQPTESPRWGLWHGDTFECPGFCLTSYRICRECATPCAAKISLSMEPSHPLSLDKWNPSLQHLQSTKTKPGFSHPVLSVKTLKKCKWSIPFDDILYKSAL